MSCGVYKITNTINNKIYIGCSINIEQRWKDHKNHYNIPNIQAYNYPIYRAFRKYGIDNFNFEIIELTEQNAIFDREKYWIQYYNSHNKDKGYNATDGGESGPQLPGESNPNAKLSEEDVYNIRLMILNGKMPSEVYPLYSHKISKRGFEHVWRGESWTNILPDAILYVKTPDYISKVRAFAKKQQDNNSGRQNLRKEIIQRKNKGESRLMVYQDFKDFYSISGFNKVWYMK